MVGRRSWVLLATLVCAILAGPPAASALVVHTPHGFIGVAPRAGISPASIPGTPAASAAPAQPRPFATNGNVDYHGGQVLHSSSPYLIFWDPAGSIQASSRALMERYFLDVATADDTGSDVFGVDRQYTDGAGFADARQTFTAAHVINDTAPYPARDASQCPDVAASYPTCISDSQLQNEVAGVVGNSGLPTGTGANAPIYFVVTPPNVNVCAPDGSTPTPCGDNIFCAYHSVVQGSGILYAAIPTLLLAHDPKGCQFDGNSTIQEPNRDIADVAISYMSHEDRETITDPLGDGWWDTNTGFETSDKCSATGAFNATTGTDPNSFLPVLGGSASAGTLFDQVINSDPYYTQTEWSNGDIDCKASPTPAVVNASFTSSASTGSPGTQIAFDPRASASSDGYSSVTWNFGDGTEVFTTGAAPAPVSHAFSIGRFFVTLTIVDPRGMLSTAVRIVQIGSPPTAAFSVSPSRAGIGSPVGFDARASHDPNLGGFVRQYLWNFGDRSTGTGAVPAHAYSAAGSYTVTLAVVDNFGLSSVTTHTVTVEQPPVARPALTTRNPEAGEAVSFSSAGSADPNGSIRAYRWQFGDGTSASGASVRHTYKRPGTYSVTLSVTGSEGVVSSSTLSVAVAARVTTVSAQKRAGAYMLLVTANGAGLLTVGHHSTRLRKPGTAKLPLLLSSSQQRQLAAAGKLVLSVAVKFQPSLGSAQRTTHRVTLRP